MRAPVAPADDEAEVAGAAPVVFGEVFPWIRWEYSSDEMKAILNLDNRRRLTAELRELLRLPCMKVGWDDTDDTDGRTGDAGLREASVTDKLAMVS